MSIKELHTLLNLHYRDPKENPDMICRKCGKEIDDQTHWMICEENYYKIEDAITEALEETEKKEIPKRKELKEIVERFKENIRKGEKAIPISLIMEEDVLKTSGKRDKEKTLKFIHAVTKRIYEGIWLRSRRVLSSMEAVK